MKAEEVKCCTPDGKIKRYKDCIGCDKKPLELNQNKMKKQTKLFIAFILASISALLMPIFGQWYEQQTGIEPILFYLIWAAGGFVSVMLIVMKYIEM